MDAGDLDDRSLRGVGWNSGPQGRGFDSLQAHHLVQFKLYSLCLQPGPAVLQFWRMPDQKPGGIEALGEQTGRPHEPPITWTPGSRRREGTNPLVSGP